MNSTVSYLGGSTYRNHMLGLCLRLMHQILMILLNKAPGTVYITTFTTGPITSLMRVVSTPTCLVEKHKIYFTLTHSVSFKQKPTCHLHSKPKPTICVMTLGLELYSGAQGHACINIQAYMHKIHLNIYIYTKHSQKHLQIQIQNANIHIHLHIITYVYVYIHAHLGIYNIYIY